MTGFCESCDGLMSDNGLYPISDNISWAIREYHRKGKFLIVPKIDHNAPVICCSDCSNAMNQPDDETKHQTHTNSLRRAVGEIDGALKG